MIFDKAMDMDRLDATQPAAKAILCGVCCRDPPTWRDDLIGLFGGGTTVPLAFHLSSDGRRCDTMDQSSTISAPHRGYHGELAKALALLEKIVVDGLRHGFFDCSIECKIVEGRKRVLVIREGKSHQFYIPQEELPR